MKMKMKITRQKEKKEKKKGKRKEKISQNYVQVFTTTRIQVSTCVQILPTSMYKNDLECFRDQRLPEVDGARSAWRSLESSKELGLLVALLGSLLDVRLWIQRAVTFSYHYFSGFYTNKIGFNIYNSDFIIIIIIIIIIKLLLFD